MKDHTPLRLFVYGTLMPGQENHHYLANIAGNWQRASIRGVLYPDGIGLASGYPALLFDSNGPEVPGWLLSSEELGSHWPELDEFEGFAYQRQQVEVQTENRAIVKAFVYLLAEGAEHGR